MTKRFVIMPVAGFLLTGGTAGATSVASSWGMNGVLCTGTGKGTQRGVMCGLTTGKKLVIVNQKQIIVFISGSSRVVHLLRRLYTRVRTATGGARRCSPAPAMLRQHLRDRSPGAALAGGPRPVWC